MTPWTAARQAPLSFTISQSFLRFVSIESVMLSKHILCHPLLLLPSLFPIIRVFSNKPAFHIRWPQYWSFSFSNSLFNEYSGLISFRKSMVWSPCSPRDSQESSPAPQFKSIISSVLSLLYGPALTSVHDTGKTIALTIWTFVGKVMFLLFNTLSRFVIAFKGVSIFEFHGCSHCPQWFWSFVVWRQIYNNTKCHCFNSPPPSICHDLMGPDAMILVFWILSFKPIFSLSSFAFIKRLFTFCQRA